jgi:hypothetical protein
VININGQQQQQEAATRQLRQNTGYANNRNRKEQQEVGASTSIRQHPSTSIWRHPSIHEHPASTKQQMNYTGNCRLPNQGDEDQEMCCYEASSVVTWL